MAKFDLKFLDTFDFTKSIRSIYNYQSDEEFNEHWIEISINSEGLTKTICLDKSTAIKFAKTLRTEINKITESEVCND